MQMVHKPSKAQTEYRPSRIGPGADPMDTVSLNGDCVRDAQGEEIGRIEGVMLDASRDRIMYAVLSLGGSLGADARLFAVPWSVLTVNTDQACVILDVPRERLRHAPRFDRYSWPRSPTAAGATRSMPITGPAPAQVTSLPSACRTNADTHRPFTDTPVRKTADKLPHCPPQHAFRDRCWPFAAQRGGLERSA